jgi:hypothetical protein
MILTLDGRIAELAGRWLDPADFVAIRRRTIGAGHVGGKATGVILARAVLVRSDARWARRLEPDRAWFVASDVFDGYLARNGIDLPEARDGEPPDVTLLLEAAVGARERIRRGAFPAEILVRFGAMLEDLGEGPIVVRSSSLLEDGLGGAFTGKYDTVFCANRGAPEERLAGLLAAARQVYASTLGEKALRYREHRGLLDRDEGMALLVQPVSGSVHGDLFFPQVAGVALSYNPWTWDPGIDPRAGMARIALGLGTRVVDRSEDDHTRLVALDAPLARPEAGGEDRAEAAQRRVDVLDLRTGRVDSRPLEEVAAASPGLPLDLFAATRPGAPPVLTFDKLLAATPFVEEVRAMLRTLSEAWGLPVEIELTANFLRGGALRLNVVQCRPLHVKEGGAAPPPPSGLPEEAVLLSSRGPILGRSTHAPVDRVVYVDPDAYRRLDEAARHEVARAVGRATALASAGAGRPRTLLVGPGRWGTTTPALGVPTAFAEVHRVSALCELVESGGKAVPDVSLGSHFFDELVEADMLYVAVHAGLPGHRLAEDLLRRGRNVLPELLPQDAHLSSVLHVLDFPLPGDGRTLWLDADFLRQQALCYLAPPRGEEGPVRSAPRG